jgi:hypothetical protein
MQIMSIQQRFLLDPTRTKFYQYPTSNSTVRKGRKVKWTDDTGDGRKEGRTDGCGLHMRCWFLYFFRNARSWMHCRSELGSCGALTKSREYEDITLWSHWSKIIMELSLYTPGSCPVEHSHGCGGWFFPCLLRGVFQYRADGQMSAAIGLLRDSRCPATGLNVPLQGA